jgi:hypothetical protein
MLNEDCFYECYICNIWSNREIFSGASLRFINFGDTFFNLDNLDLINGNVIAHSKKVYLIVANTWDELECREHSTNINKNLFLMLNLTFM